MDEIIKQLVKEIFDLYRELGDKEYIGEPVSQIEHMSQAAALAEAEGFDEEVILAAFFHDIGHLCAPDSEDMAGLGKLNHEELGAEYLRKQGFSERLIRLVKSHVSAKRYLTFKDPEYYNRLSEASKQTLNFQGGVMTQDEAANFETDPDREIIIKMRLWDDAAKLTDIPVLNINTLMEMTLKHLNVNIAGSIVSQH